MVSRIALSIALATVLALAPFAVAAAQLVGEGAQARTEIHFDDGPGTDCSGTPPSAIVAEEGETANLVVGGTAAAASISVDGDAAARALWSLGGDGPIGARAGLIGFGIQNGHVMAVAEYRSRVRVEDRTDPGATGPITVDVEFALEGESTVVDFSGEPMAGACARIFAQMEIDGTIVFAGEAIVESGGPGQAPTLRLGNGNAAGAPGNPQGFELADFSATTVDTAIFGPADGIATQVSHTHQLTTLMIGDEYEVSVTLVTDAFIALGFENLVVNDHFDSLSLRFEGLDQGGSPLPDIRFRVIPPATSPAGLSGPPIVTAHAIAEKALNNPFNAFSETDWDSDAWNLTDAALARAQAGTIPAGSGQGVTAAVAEAELPAQGQFGFRQVRVISLAGASGPPPQGVPADDGGHSQASGSYRLNITPEYTGGGSPPLFIPIDLDIEVAGALGAFLVPSGCVGCGAAPIPPSGAMTARVDVEVDVHVGNGTSRIFLASALLDRGGLPGGSSQIVGEWKGEPDFTIGTGSVVIDHRKLYLDQALVPFAPFGVEFILSVETRSDFTTTRYTRVDTFADFFDSGSLGVGTSAQDVTLKLVVPEPASALSHAFAVMVLAALCRRTRDRVSIILARG